MSPCVCVSMQVREAGDEGFGDRSHGVCMHVCRQTSATEAANI